MATGERAYRGVPAEERRADRRVRLVAAGLDLFGTRGIAETRVDDVCAAAGLTKRYFYEHFDSLDELVQSVVEDVLGELTVRMVPVIAAHGSRHPEPVLTAFFEAVLADPRLVRLLVVETHVGSLATRRHEMIERAVDIWLAVDPMTGGRDDHLPVQRLLAHAMAGAAGEVALAWAAGRIDMPAEELTRHVVRIFKRITPSGRRRSPG